jgi:hypothetical protein
MEINSRLNHRYDAMKAIISYLENLNKPLNIVETGCIRILDNWEGDGQSTILWDNLVNLTGGMVYSIDIDPIATSLTQSLVSDRVKVYTADSISTLTELALTDIKIDLLYLDSYDIDWDNPNLSMEHHLKEFKAAAGMLSKGSVVAVDDNIILGKGYLIGLEAERLGYSTLIDSYIRAWIVE